MQATADSITVAVTAPGVVSFLASPDGRRVVRQVTASDSIQAVPRLEIGRHLGRGASYLATVFPSVAIVVLRSEADLVVGETIPVEIEHDQSGTVAIPTGHSRTPFDLSPWLIAALRESRRNGVRDEAEFVRHVRPRSDRYRMVGAGEAASTTLEERLVAAYSLALRDSGTPPEQAHDLLAEWLGGPGGGILTGRPLAYTEATTPSYDVTPIIAAVLLLALLSGDADAAALSVHGAHVLGLLAAGAMHQEVLLRDWLLRDPGSPRHGRWERLARLDLGGRTLPRPGDTNADDPFGDSDPYVVKDTTSDSYFDGLLTPAQLGQLRYCCQGVLRTWEEPDPTLRATARALLFATGQMENADDLWDDFRTTELAGLNALGRALAPGSAHPISQSRLSPSQVDHLRQRFGRTLAGGLPLSVLPSNMPDLPLRSASWAEETVRRTLDKWSE